MKILVGCTWTCPKCGRLEYDKILERTNREAIASTKKRNVILNRKVTDEEKRNMHKLFAEGKNIHFISQRFATGWSNVKTILKQPIPELVKVYAEKLANDL